MKKIKYIILNAFLAMMAIGCSTLSELKKKPDDSQITGLAGNGVIAKAGATHPIISPVDTKTWIEMSESKESGREKLNGLLATGKWQEAAEEARRGLEKQPGDQASMSALTAAYALGKNFEMAGYFATSVLKSEPSNADALNILGLRTMMRTGNRRTDYEDAIAFFKKAAENDGTHVASLFNMGSLQLDLGDAQSAMESFSMARGRCGQCFEADYGFGLAAMRAEQWPQAKSAFEDILARQNNRAAAQYQLAMVMNRGFNDNAKAISLLQNLVSDPDGRFKDSGNIKRAANITLRRWRASDRTAPIPEEANEPRNY